MSIYSRSSRREFLRDTAVAGASFAFGGALLEACGSATNTASHGIASSGKPSRKNTLYIGGFQWGYIPNFNPLGPNSSWPTAQGSQMMHVYEALFGFDVLAGDIKGILAKGISYPDPATFVISLHPEAHWQDGKALTADDVVYTYQLARQHTELNYAQVWQYITDVTKKDDHTVQISLNKDKLNPGQVRHFLARTWILPKHIWTGIEANNSSLLTYTETRPVGSGPYKVYDFSAQRVALVRDENYWGKSVYGTPAPAYIIHPIFKDNDSANLAFQNAELDFCQTFLPQIWQLWEDKKLPVGTWLKNPPYHLPGNIPMIFLNVKRKGLDNPKVRQALAYAINYSQIAETAMSRYSVPVNSSLIIPDGGEKKYFDASGVKQYGWSYDKTKATQILESQLGAKKGGDGIYALPDGTRLGPWKAQCPYGWTDWMTSLQGVSDSAKAIGIDISTNFPEQPQDIAALQNGDFDIAMYSVTGADPSSPWGRFHDVLDSRGIPAPGQNAFWDYNRFSDASAAALLDKAASAGDQRPLLSQLDQLFMQNIPAIPLEYRPLEFFEYHQSVWTGFPNSSNPTAPPTTLGAGIKWLYSIRLKG